MKQPAIFDSLYNELKNKDSVTIDGIKKLLSDKEYMEFKTFIRLFSKTIFRAYKDSMSEEKIFQIMVLRREVFIDDPKDNEEYEELIEYFESIEDYESCQKIKKHML